MRSWGAFFLNMILWWYTKKNRQQLFMSFRFRIIRFISKLRLNKQRQNKKAHWFWSHCDHTLYGIYTYKTDIDSNSLWTSAYEPIETWWRHSMAYTRPCIKPYRFLVMAWCMFDAKPLPELMTTYLVTLKNTLQWRINRNPKLSFKKMYLKMLYANTSAILFKPGCVNPL